VTDNVTVSNKCHSFELSLNNVYNIDNNHKCVLIIRSSY